MSLNNSIFDLAHSVDELRSPEQAIKVSSLKVNPKGNSTGASFPGGNIVFDFSLSGSSHWIPSRSFVVIRDEIYYSAANRQPKNDENVAPSFLCQNNLFNGADLSIGGSYSLGNISLNIFHPQY